jgi:hypothetical protein
MYTFFAQYVVTHIIVEIVKYILYRCYLYHIIVNIMHNIFLVIASAVMKCISRNSWDLWTPGIEPLA